MAHTFFVGQKVTWNPDLVKMLLGAIPGTPMTIKKVMPTPSHMVGVGHQLVIVDGVLFNISWMGRQFDPNNTWSGLWFIPLADPDCFALGVADQ
jgi:hypothetical protein